MSEGEEKGLKPIYVWVFIASVLMCLGAIALIMPADGFHVFGKKMHFVSLNQLFNADSEDKLDVESLMQARQDSLQAQKERMLQMQYATERDSIEAANKIASADPTRIQYSNTQRAALDQFFEALATINENGGAIRVIHYGDSQIEEDRISSLIRKKLQSRFGGSGVGLIAAQAVTHSQTISQSSSENWKRYTAFGAGGLKAENGHYGAMTIMCKYNNVMMDSVDSVLVQKNFQSGWVSVSPRSGVHETVKNYNRVRIFLAQSGIPVTVRITHDGETDSKQVQPQPGVQIVTFDLAHSPAKLQVSFEGPSSPEVFGISLETAKGVHVDNIPMRGGSGTIFPKLNNDIARPMFDALNPRLVIMQFGGNVMPYIKSKKQAENYAADFQRNIQRVKSFCPKAAILVIGPSDMSTRIDGRMQTYPNLPDVRDALRQAAFESGAAYFDLFEVMGGLNSMPSWVETSPPLAAADYIHFSPRGALKVAEILYESLMLDYEQYLRRRKIPTKE
jgi:lysophospholipase L1-like esterase